MGAVPDDAPLTGSYALSFPLKSLLYTSISRRVRKHDVSRRAIANLDPLHDGAPERQAAGLARGCESG